MGSDDRAAALREEMNRTLIELAAAARGVDTLTSRAYWINLRVQGGDLDNGYPEDDVLPLDRAARRVHTLGLRLTDIKRSLREVRAATAEGEDEDGGQAGDGPRAADGGAETGTTGRVVVGGG